MYQKKGERMHIKLNLQIFLFVIIFYLTKQIEIYATLMIFATIHELAHIIMGIALGLKPKTLKIMPFGLSICFESNKKSTAVKICIALAGPVINLVLALLFYILKINFWSITTETIIYANILLALFNLIPIYPLDGGRIIKYILEKFQKKDIAITLTDEISYFTIIVLTIIGSIIILYYKNIAIVLILLYLWTLVIRERRKNKLRLRVYKILQKV